MTRDSETTHAEAPKDDTSRDKDASPADKTPEATTPGPDARFRDWALI